MTIEDLSFAIDVLQHRERQREEKAQREQERLERERIHQTRMQTMYGIDPPTPSVVTPPQKGDNLPLEPPLTTDRESTKSEEIKSHNSLPKTLEKLKPCFELLEGIIKEGKTVIKEMKAQLLVNRVGQKLGFFVQNQLHGLIIEIVRSLYLMKSL